MSLPNRGVWAAVGAFLVYGLVVVSPGFSKTGAAPITPPPAIAKAGVLNICTDPTLGPPASYLSGGKHLGSDVEIGEEVAKLMGVKSDVITISAPTLVADIASGQCDTYIGGISDTKPREKQMNFADYANVGDQMLVLKGNPKHIASEDSLSGLTVSVFIGSTEQQQLEALSKKLQAAGKKPITVRVFEQGTAAVQALAAGQVDAVDQSFPALLSLLKAQPGRYQLALPHEINTYPWGMVSGKSDTGLNAAFKKAIAYMYKTGSIQAILTKAGLGDTALKHG
jgi:polar amino acid transport system substrate-binding protein